MCRGSCTRMAVMGGSLYTRGLHALNRDTFAYLSPPGTWGWSNCGLVVSGAQALLVDTQFTVPLTRELLDPIEAHSAGVVIETVVTTHANGDHCWGNQLLGDAQIIGSAALKDELAHEVQPEQLAALSG